MDILSRTEILNDFARYQDKYGLLSGIPFPPVDQNENGALFTANMFVTLKKLGIEIGFDEGIFRQLQVPGHRGLFGRYVGGLKGRQDGWDNITGLCTVSYLYDLSIAKDIYQYAESVGWWINNVRPGTKLNLDGSINWKCYFGNLRYPHLRAHIKWACKDPAIQPSWLERKAWLAAVNDAARTMVNPTNTDGAILMWHFATVGGDKSPENRAAVAELEFQLNRKFPGGMKGVFGAYFNPAQPLAKWAVL